MNDDFGLLYSQRKMVAERAEAACKERVPLMPTSLITALDSLGYIDREAVRRDYRKMLAEKDQTHES